MPLIIVTGLPTSGKTTRATELQAFLAGQGAAVRVVSDETAGVARTAYDLSGGNGAEKAGRAATQAAVGRALGGGAVVLLDGLNYIRGWRYQLWCEARAARTRCAVLRVGCAVDVARAVNAARLLPLPLPLPLPPPSSQKPQQQPDGYAPASWDNLVARYEEPDAMARWECPLFAIAWDDGAEVARDVYARLWQAVSDSSGGGGGSGSEAVRPCAATAPRTRNVGADYLFRLERETQEVVREALARQESGGGPVALPAGRAVGPAELQRLRRAFVGLHRGGIGLEGVGTMAVDRIRDLFVQYLNDRFEAET